MIDPEILESSRCFAEAWKFWASRSEAGAVASRTDLAMHWMGVAWPICNLTFLTGPVADEAALASRARAAVDFARDRGHGWLLFCCRDFLPDSLRQPAPDVLIQEGLTLRGGVTGMVTERLLPPRRELPDLDFQRVGEPESRQDFADVNALAYKVPIEWGRQALDVADFYDESTFAYVAYHEGEPASTAEVIVMGEVLYMALVATRPEMQRKGFAEATMRHALAEAKKETGLERTVLQASGAGLHLYEEMGYRKVVPFFGFAP